MKKITLTYILLLFTLCSFGQERAYISWFEVSNIHKGYQVSATKIFKTFVLDAGKYDVVLGALPDSLYKGESMEQAQSKAKSHNAQYIVMGELNKIGSTVVVSIQMFNTNDLSRKWNGMLRAKSPDDLDPVLMRLAKDLGTATVTKESESIYNVTDYESRELNKVNSNSFFGVGLGGAAMIRPSISGGIPAGLNLFFSYDARNIILDIKGEAYFKDGAFYFLSIDGLYPLSQNRNSLFVGGGLGVGGMALTTEQNGGLLLTGNLGYIINRNASTPLRVAAKPFVSLFNINNSVAFGSILTVSILFER